MLTEIFCEITGCSLVAPGSLLLSYVFWRNFLLVASGFELAKVGGIRYMLLLAAWVHHITKNCFRILFNFGRLSQRIMIGPGILKRIHTRIVKMLRVIVY